MKTYKTTTPQFSITKNKSDFPKAKITSSKDAEQFIRQFYFDDIGIYESFFILLLNRSNITTGYAKISQGGTAGTVVDIKIIAKYIADTLAHGIILAHNHPSGNTNPSQADYTITKNVQKAAQLFDCTLLDHVILNEETYFSFADNGKL